MNNHNNIEPINKDLNLVKYEEETEINFLRSQFVTLNENEGRGRHRKYLPYVFTEQGIAMLSGLLRNEIAVQVSINITKLDIKKFNEQYGTLKIARTDNFHDRFIIIDNKELYHCGASLKDLGKKCFGINKIEGIEFIENINKIINF